MIKAIIFDLDNTLNHRAATIRRYANVFLIDFRQKIFPEVALPELTKKIECCDAGGYAGRTARCKSLLALEIWQARPTQEELLDHWLGWVPNNPTPMKGLVPTLNSLKEMDLHLGIITNGSSVSQRRKITALGIEDHFNKITISGEIGIAKPNLSIFQETLKAMAVKAEDAIFVGDHPQNDILAAQEIGMTPVWISGFHPWPESTGKPKNIIDNLSNLQDTVRAIIAET